MLRGIAGDDSDFPCAYVDKRGSLAIARSRKAAGNPRLLAVSDPITHGFSTPHVVYPS